MPALVNAGVPSGVRMASGRTPGPGSIISLIGSSAAAAAADRTAEALSAGDVLGVALGILAADIPCQADAPEAWPRWAALLTHVLTATSYLNSLTNQLGQAALKDGALLLDRAGSYLGLRARPADAQPLLERAVAITAVTYGLDHPAFAASLNNLGSVLLDQVEPEQAQPLLERALAIVEAFYGPDHREVAAALNDLGSVLCSLGKPEQALPLAERALAIVEASYGPDHLIIAGFLSRLASILIELKEPKGWDMMERAMNIEENAYGPDFPNTVLHRYGKRLARKYKD